MVDADKDVVVNLETVRQLIREQRVAHEDEIANLTRRETLVQQALEGFDAKPTARKRSATGSTTLSISDDRFERVREYLAKHPRAKQTDIVSNLRLNSGTVSVALRKLEQTGMVEKAPEKQDGSQVWIMNDGRETVVTPGEGSRKGRRRKVAA